MSQKGIGDTLRSGDTEKRNEQRSEVEGALSNEKRREIEENREEEEALNDLKKNLDSAIKMLQFNRWKASRSDDFGVGSHMTPRRGVLPGRESSDGVGDVEKREKALSEVKNDSTGTLASHAATTTYYQGVQGVHGLSEREEEEKRMEEVKKKVEEELQKIDSFLQRHTSSHYPSLISLHSISDRHKKDLKNMKPKIDSMTETVKKGREDLISLRSSLLLSLLHRIDLFSKEAFSYYASHAVTTAHDLKTLQKSIFQFKSKLMISELQSSSSSSSLPQSHHMGSSTQKEHVDVSAAAGSSGWNAKPNLPRSLVSSASSVSPTSSSNDKHTTPSKNLTSQAQRSLAQEKSSQGFLVSSSFEEGFSEDFFESQFEEVDLNELGIQEETENQIPNKHSPFEPVLSATTLSPPLPIQVKLGLLEEGLDILTKAERLYKKYLSLQFKTHLFLQLSQDVESSLNVGKEGDDANAAKTTNQAKERSPKPTSPTSHRATPPSNNSHMKETPSKLDLFQEEDDWIQSSLLPSLITSLSLLTHLCLSLIVKHEAMFHGSSQGEEEKKAQSDEKMSSTAIVTRCLGHLKILLDMHASLAIESSFIQQVRAQVIEPLLVFPILASTPTSGQSSPLVTQYGFNPTLAAQAWSGDAPESTASSPSTSPSMPSTPSTTPSIASSIPLQPSTGSELALKSPLWIYFLSPILSYLRSSRLLQFVGTYASSSLHRPLSLAIHIAKQRKESSKKTHTNPMAPASTARSESQATLDHQRIGSMNGEEGRRKQQEMLENEAHVIFLKACAPSQSSLEDRRKEDMSEVRCEQGEMSTSQTLLKRVSQEAPYYHSFINVLQSLRKVVAGAENSTLKLGPMALLDQSSTAHHHLYPRSLLNMSYENADKTQQANRNREEKGEMDDTFNDVAYVSDHDEGQRIDDWWNASSEERHELAKEVDKKWYLTYLGHLPFPFGMPPIVAVSEGVNHSDDLERMMGEETSLSHGRTDVKSRTRDERHEIVGKGSDSTKLSNKRTAVKDGASRSSLDGESPRSSSHVTRHAGSLTNANASALHRDPSQERLLAKRSNKLTSSSQHPPGEAPSLSSLIKSLIKTSRDEYDRTMIAERSVGEVEKFNEASGRPTSAATTSSNPSSSDCPSPAPVNFFNVLPASDFAMVMGMDEEELYSLLIRLLTVFPSATSGNSGLEGDLMKEDRTLGRTSLSQQITLPRWFYSFPSSPFLWIDLIWNPMLASIVSAASGNAGGSSHSANLYKSIFSPSLSPSVRRRNMILFAHFCEELEGSMNDLFQVLSFRLSSSSSSLPSLSPSSKMLAPTGAAAKIGSEKAGSDTHSTQSSSASLKPSSAPQSSWMMQHWNLTGYVSLHTKHVVETFELSFSSLLVPSRLPQLFCVPSVPNSQALHPLVALLDQSIVNIWNPNAFLFPLTHRFLKLSLQLFHQFYLHICGKGDSNPKGALLDASSNSASSASQRSPSSSADSTTFLSLLEGAHLNQAKWQEENEGNLHNLSSTSHQFSTCKALMDVLVGLEKWLSPGAHEVNKLEAKAPHPHFSNALFSRWIPQISTSSHQETKVWALVQDSLRDGILQSHSLIQSSFYLKLPSFLLSSFPMQSFTTNMKEIGQRYRFGSTLPTSSQNPSSPSKHLTAIFNQFLPLFSNVSEVTKQAGLDIDASKQPEACPSFPWLSFFTSTTSYASYSGVLNFWHEPMAKEVVKSVINFLASSFLSSSKTLLTSSQKTQAFIDRKKKAGHSEKDIVKDQNVQNSDFDVFSLPSLLPQPDFLIQIPFPSIPASPPLPDHSKILIQLQLDLLFFSKALLLLNLSFEDIPSLQALWATINGQNTQ